MDAKLQKTLVSGRSSSDNRGTDLGLSSPCERTETSLPDSVGLSGKVRKLADAKLERDGWKKTSDRTMEFTREELVAVLTEFGAELLAEDGGAR